MSRCILENIVAGRKILEDCGEYDFYSEINGPRRFQAMGNTEFEKRNLLDDGKLEVKGQSARQPRMILPQHHYLKQIHNQFPNATFVLNFRPVEAWIESVMAWPTKLRNEIPNEFLAHENLLLTKQFKRYNSTVNRLLLKHYFKSHNAFVREFVSMNPSHALIEVDITDPHAGRILGDAFGLEESCWDHANKNTQRENSTSDQFDPNSRAQPYAANVQKLTNNDLVQPLKGKKLETENVVLESLKDFKADSDKRTQYDMGEEGVLHLEAMLSRKINVSMQKSRKHKVVQLGLDIRQVLEEQRTLRMQNLSSYWEW